MGSFLGSNVLVWWQTPAVAGLRSERVPRRRYGSTSKTAAPTKATAPSMNKRATGSLLADLTAHRNQR
jgi:hypothetical protein